MKAEPLITIGIPVFNGAGYLAEALRSASTQTHRNLEIIVADNASEDDSVQIVRRAQADDPRIKLLTSTNNRGAAENYNRLVGEASGDFFQWLAHDDTIEPSTIEACLKPFAERPEVVLVYPRGTIIDGHGDRVRDHDETLGLDTDSPVQRAVKLLWQVRMCHAVFGLYRTSVLRKTRLIQPYDSSDFTLLVEIALRGHIVQIEDRLFNRRRHETDSRTANRSRAEIASWFSPGARAAGRSPTLVRSYIRAAREWAPTRTSSVLAPMALALNGAMTEARWHVRRRRRIKRDQPRPR